MALTGWSVRRDEDANLFLLYFNYILSFPFLPPNTPVYCSLVSFKLMTSFSINCYFMHISICVYIYIPKYNLYNVYDIICMFTGLAIWHWKKKWGTHLWERPLLLLPVNFQFTIVFSVVFRPPDLFSVQFNIFIGLILLK